MERKDFTEAEKQVEQHLTHLFPDNPEIVQAEMDRIRAINKKLLEQLQRGQNGKLD
jgi:hypothetical protein